MTDRTPLVEQPATDDDLADLLRAVAAREGPDELLDSAILGHRLGWTAARTAGSLGAAKGRLLIWGIRVGGNPGPCFEDIELTVQGRRYLAAAKT